MAANQKVMLCKAVSDSEFPADFNIRFHTHVYCQSGSVKFVFNGKQYQSKKGEFVFWLAGINVSDLSFSTSFRATVLFVDSDLLTASLPSATASIDSIIHSKEYPILHPDKKDKEKILKNFEFTGKAWEEGSIYDPKNGKSYSCNMKLKKADELEIRGFVGVSLLGRTTVWTKVK